MSSRWSVLARRAGNNDLIPKLKCAKSGGKGVGTIYTPDSSSIGYGTKRQ